MRFLNKTNSGAPGGLAVLLLLALENAAYHYAVNSKSVFSLAFIKHDYVSLSFGLLVLGLSAHAKKADQINYALSLPTISLHFLSYLALVLVSLVDPGGIPRPLLVISRATLAASVGLSALSCALPWKSFVALSSQNRKKILLGCLAFSALMTTATCQALLWPYLVPPTAVVVRALMEMFGAPVLVKPLASAIYLESGASWIRIHSPCSGLNGVALFLSAVGLVYMLPPLGKNATLRLKLRWVLLGIGCMFGVNCIRIFLFFSISKWASTSDLEFARMAPDLFHSHAALVLYVLPIILLLPKIFHLETSR